jgi:hypothetical protein
LYLYWVVPFHTSRMFVLIYNSPIIPHPRLYLYTVISFYISLRLYLYWVVLFHTSSMFVLICSCPLLHFPTSVPMLKMCMSDVHRHKATITNTWRL